MNLNLIRKRQANVAKRMEGAKRLAETLAGVRGSRHPAPDAKQAILYARFSPRPGIKCESVEQQLTRLQAATQARSYAIHSQHSDAWESGDEVMRPGLWSALAALAPGRSLWATCVDRLARDGLLFATIERIIDDRGAHLELLDGGTGDEDTAELQLMRGILAQVAAYERILIGRRTSAGMRARQAKGQRQSGRPPYGWAIDPADASRLIPVPIEQAVIDQVLTWHVTDQLTPTQIRSRLESESYPPRSKVWTIQAVRAILRRLGAY